MLTMLSDSPWALQRTVLEQLIEQSRLETANLEAVAARSRTPAGLVLSVAILPITGLIFRAGRLSWLSSSAPRRSRRWVGNCGHWRQTSRSARSCWTWTRRAAWSRA